MADEGDSGHGRRREQQISALTSHKVKVTLLMNRNDRLKVNDVVVHGKARASRETKKKGIERCGQERDSNIASTNG